MAQTEDSRGTLEQLGRDECLTFLKSTGVGRLAVNGPRCPIVIPVNYAIDAVAITFRAREEVRQEVAEQVLVTFQADGFDAALNSAWSVMAQGVIEEMRDPGTIEPPAGFIPSFAEPWTSGPHPYWMRIVPQLVSGTVSVPRVIHLP